MRKWRSLLVLIACAASGSGLATERKALAIVNSDYDVGKISHPLSDAYGIADALEKLGFQVERLRNTSRQQLGAALYRLHEKIAPGGLALLYYAGHGVRVQGQRFVIPVDNRPIVRPETVPLHAVNLDFSFQQADRADVRLNILILDAAFEDVGPRSVIRGWTRTPERTLLAFSNPPADTAANPAGQGTRYAAVLKKLLLETDLAVVHLFAELQQRMDAETAGQQLPFLDAYSWSPLIYLGDPAPPAPLPRLEADRFQPLDPGLLRDQQTQLTWTQTDNGRNFN